MLKKLGAALLLVGLLLPYSCDARPITALWNAGSLNDVLTISIPVLAAVIYILHTLAPPLARFHERHAMSLSGLLFVLTMTVAVAFVYGAITGDSDEWMFMIVGVVVVASLLYWARRRGSIVDRLPLLMLAPVGIAALSFFTSLLDTGDLKVGGWLATAGYVVATIGEVMALRSQPITSAVPHSDTPRDAPV
jgi:LPXTG-motif cell wall-anchored protein